MTKRKAKQLIHKTVAEIWLAKQLRNDERVSRESFDQHLAEIRKSWRDTWMGITFLVMGLIVILAIGFVGNYCYSSKPVTTAGIASLLLISAALSSGLIIQGVRLIVREAPRPIRAVQLLVTEYLELHSQLSEVDLWGDYVQCQFDEGCGARAIISEAESNQEFISPIWAHQAEESLYRIGREVLRLRKEESRSSSVYHKTVVFIPAFDLAKQVGAITGSGGYGRYIPKGE